MSAASVRISKMRLPRGVRPDLASYLCCLLPILLLIMIWTWWPLGGLNEFYFLSVGDFGTASTSQRLVAAQMAIQAAKKQVKFVLSLGDNVYPSGVKNLTDTQFNTVFEDIYTQESLQIPWYMTLGDHDHRGNAQTEVDFSKVSKKWNMSSPYYKVTVPLGGRHSLDLVVTDSVCLEGFISTGTPQDRRFFEDYNETMAGSEAGKAHLLWLEETLHSSSADWLVVVGHRPVLSCAERPRFPAENRFSELLELVLSKHHVDVYINGHDHVAQHLEKNGVVYIGNGVGGYGNHPAHPNKETVWVNDSCEGFILHRVTPAELSFTFMASDGAILHEVRLFQSQMHRDMRRRKAN